MDEFFAALKRHKVARVDMAYIVVSIGAVKTS